MDIEEYIRNDRYESIRVTYKGNHMLGYGRQTKFKKPPYSVGDKVHLRSMNGTYTIVSMGYLCSVITCKVWQTKYKSGLLSYYQKKVNNFDIK